MRGARVLREVFDLLFSRVSNALGPKRSGATASMLRRAAPGRALGATLVFTLGAALVVGPVAHAFIPMADRTMSEIAKVNRASKRNQALQLDLTMSVGGREPIARGQLISHPSGLARLELKGFNGRVDRYLLSGRELLGAKDGLRLDRPQPLLQPFFFLQPSTETTLRAALEAFDILSGSIGLATCGDEDCFVIGDPRLAAPLPTAQSLALGDGIGSESVIEDPLDPDAEGQIYKLAAATNDGSRREGALEGPELGISEQAHLPRLWVDTEDLQVRRIDRASGVFTIFGPIVSFDKVMVPAWFEVHEPDAEPIRFDVNRAVQVNAPPQAFSRKWVFSPVDPPAESGAPNGTPPAADRSNTAPPR